MFVTEGHHFRRPQTAVTSLSRCCATHQVHNAYLRGYDFLRPIGQSLCRFVCVACATYSCYKRCSRQQTKMSTCPSLTQENSLQITEKYFSNSFHFRPLFLSFFVQAVTRKAIFRSPGIPTYVNVFKPEHTAEGSARGIHQCCQLPNKNSRDISSNICNFSPYLKSSVYLFHDYARSP